LWAAPFFSFSPPLFPFFAPLNVSFFAKSPGDQNEKKTYGWSPSLLFPSLLCRATFHYFSLFFQGMAQKRGWTRSFNLFFPLPARPLLASPSSGPGGEGEWALERGSLSPFFFLPFHVIRNSQTSFLSSQGKVPPLTHPRQTLPQHLLHPPDPPPPSHAFPSPHVFSPSLLPLLSSPL